DDRVLEEVAFIDLLLELVPLDEVIVHAFELAGAHRSRGRRDDVRRVRVGEPQLLKDGVLAHTGGPRDDEDARSAGISQPLNAIIALLEAGLQLAFQGKLLAD